MCFTDPGKRGVWSGAVAAPGLVDQGVPGAGQFPGSLPHPHLHHTGGRGPHLPLLPLRPHRGTAHCQVGDSGGEQTLWMDVCLRMDDFMCVCVYVCVCVCVCVCRVSVYE